MVSNNDLRVELTIGDEILPIATGLFPSLHILRAGAMASLFQTKQCSVELNLMQRLTDIYFRSHIEHGPRLKHLAQEGIDQLLAGDDTKPVGTEWATPMVFIQMKDCICSFSVKYHKMSLLMIRDSYPVPQVDEYIDLQADTMILSILGGNCGYWQVENFHDDQDKTACTSHLSLSRSPWMPFVLEYDRRIF